MGVKEDSKKAEEEKDEEEVVVVTTRSALVDTTNLTTTNPPGPPPPPRGFPIRSVRNAQDSVTVDGTRSGKPRKPLLIRVYQRGDGVLDGPGPRLAVLAQRAPSLDLGLAAGHDPKEKTAGGKIEVV